MNFEPLTKKYFGGLLAIGLLVTAIPLFAQTNEGQREQVLRFDRVAAMTSVTGNERKLCSAFFVLHSERMFLITAKHSSLETNLTTEVALPSAGALLIFRLSEATRKRGVNPWLAHESADVAVCELGLSKLEERVRKSIEHIAVKIEQCQRELPQRSSRIEVIGFPMGLGITQERISPLVHNCFVASEELSLNGTWGREVNFLASPAVGSGASGGLVTVHAEDARDCTVVGVFVGFNGDTSGAKLARILPANIMVDFIQLQTDANRTASKREENNHEENKRGEEKKDDEAKAEEFLPDSSR